MLSYRLSSVLSLRLMPLAILPTINNHKHSAQAPALSVSSIVRAQRSSIVHRSFFHRPSAAVVRHLSSVVRHLSPIRICRHVHHHDHNVQIFAVTAFHEPLDHASWAEAGFFEHCQGAKGP